MNSNEKKLRQKRLAERNRLDLEDHADEVDWVVVYRTAEGEKNLITNFYELMEVLRVLSLRGWKDWEIADLIVTAGDVNADARTKKVMWKFTEKTPTILRNRYGMEKEHERKDVPLTIKEATRIVKMRPGKLPVKGPRK